MAGNIENIVLVERFSVFFFLNSHITHENFIHQENKPVKFIPPYTPLLYRKTGVCRGIPIFLLKIMNFCILRKICILYGHVFIMYLKEKKNNKTLNMLKDFLYLIFSKLFKIHIHVETFYQKTTLYRLTDFLYTFIKFTNMYACNFFYIKSIMHIDRLSENFYESRIHVENFYVKNFARVDIFFLNHFKNSHTCRKIQI